MTNTNIVEKFNLLKSAVEDSNMAYDFKLAYTDAQAEEYIVNATGRRVIVKASTALLATKNDYIRFDLFIADKVNDYEDDTYVLQSWANGMVLLRHISNILNYVDSENIVLEEVSLDVSDKLDKAQENVVATLYTKMEFELEVVPNIKIERQQ